jgi:hypothetical protein
MIPVDYMEKYVNVPPELRICRIWNGKEMIRDVSIGKHMVMEIQDTDIVMYPVGRKDSRGREIYVGDIAEITIETKFGPIQRTGILRREGLYCVGIDYLDKKDNLTDDGDYIDEFYISEMSVIGNIFEGIYETRAAR